MIARLWTALGALAAAVERFAAAVNGLSGQVEQHAGLAGDATTGGTASPQLPAPSQPDQPQLPAGAGNGDAHAAAATPARRRRGRQD